MIEERSLDMEQPIVLLDSNILISLLVFGGEIQKIYTEMLNRRYIVFTTQYIDHEFRNKIIEKWGKDQKIIFELYGELRIPVFESKYDDTIKTRDIKDNYVIGDAIAYKVDYLLTGDKDLLTLKELPVVVISPSDMRDKILMINTIP